MNNILQIGIDSGKSYTKSCFMLNGEYLVDEFRTNEKVDEVKDGDNILHYDGNRYVVGEEIDVASANNTEHTKLTNTHQVCVLTAICKAIQKVPHEINEVHITLNMVLQEFLDTKDKEALKQRYEGQYNLIYNNQDYSFKIKLKPYYEGMGTSIQNNHIIGEVGEVVVLDIGSLNINVITFNAQGKPMRNRSITLERGLEKLKREIIDAQVVAVKKTFTPSQTELMIAKQFKLKEKTDIINEVTSTTVLKHLSIIKAELFNREIDLETLTIICSGGGAMMLKSYIRQVWGTDVKFSPDDQYTNAKETLKLLKG